MQYICVLDYNFSGNDSSKIQQSSDLFLHDFANIASQSLKEHLQGLHSTKGARYLQL